MHSLNHSYTSCIGGILWNLKTKGKVWGEILSRKSFYYFFLCTVHSYNHALLYYFLFRVDGCGMVKMADFGLSKSTYEKLYFRQDKSDNVRLPIKWLAVECIEDGIILWEIRCGEYQLTETISYMYMQMWACDSNVHACMAWHRWTDINS